MAFETNDDIDLFFDVFASVVVYSGATFNGIFDNDYFDAEVGGSVTFATSQPRLTVPTYRVAGMVDGDTLTVDGVSYTVRVIMNDGTGVSVLMIEAV